MNLHSEHSEALAFFNERGERLGNAYLVACQARGVEPAPAAWMHNIRNPSELLAVVFVGFEPVEISAQVEAELVALAVEVVVRHAALAAMN